MKTRCPYCLANVAETLSHLFCECTRWASKRLGIFGSMAKLFAKLPVILGCFHSLLGVRLVVTNSLEENSRTTVEMQEKKALDEAIHLWWTNSKFSY